MPSRWVGAFFSLVGVLMFLGFGGVLAMRAIDSARAPEEPTHVDGAALLAAARGGTRWVAVDALEPCAFPLVPSGASRATYRVLAGTSGAAIGLAEVMDGRACSDEPHAMRGTIRERVLADLQLPPDAEAFLVENLGPDVAILCVDDSPHLGFGETALWGAMAAVGLCVAWFYAAAFFARSARVRLAARASRPALPLLPSRPLSLAPAYRASPWIALVFFSVCALMFAGIVASILPAEGTPLDLAMIAILVFCGAIALAFVAFFLLVLRTMVRARVTVHSPREAWAPLVKHEVALAKGFDVGNRAIAYRDPFTRDGEPENIVEIVIGANEGMPWIVDDHVLVMRAEGSPVQYVMREDGGPFALSDAEIAAMIA